MRRSMKALAAAAALVAGLAVAPTLFAHESQESAGSMMGHGMMGQGGMMDGMSGMMESCSSMMQTMTPGGSGRPNEQWRQDAPGMNGKPETNN